MKDSLIEREESSCYEVWLRDKAERRTPRNFLRVSFENVMEAKGFRDLYNDKFQDRDGLEAYLVETKTVVTRTMMQ